VGMVIGLICSNCWMFNI